MEASQRKEKEEGSGELWGAKFSYKKETQEKKITMDKSTAKAIYGKDNNQKAIKDSSESKTKN